MDLNAHCLQEAHTRKTRWPIGSFLAALMTAVAFTLGTSACTPSHGQEKSWVTTWSASPQPIWREDIPMPTKVPPSIESSTIRQILRVSLGGERLRVVVSNAYGRESLLIGAATVGVSKKGASVLADSVRWLTFGGRKSIRVPPGAPAISDPVDLSVEDLERIAVSIFLPDNQPLTTFHWDGRDLAYIATGNVVSEAQLSTSSTTSARIFLSQVLVETPNHGSTVIIGDSITDGNGATLGADSRWPDFLAKKLVDRRTAVVNAGISGARLLSDGMGVNALARFNRDVLSMPGVDTVVILLGINDIAWPGTPFAPDALGPSVARIKQGFRQLGQRARVHGVRFVGATLLPFEQALPDTLFSGYYTPKKDAVRREINRWIRSSSAFDAVVDFDAELRDNDSRGRLQEKYDSGDHLHPGDAGNKKMAEIAFRAIFE